MSYDGEIQIQRYKLAWWKPDEFLYYALLMGIYLASIDLFSILWILIVLLIILGICWKIGRLSFSYLELSPNGIKYRNWPIRCQCASWEDVEKIDHFPWLFNIIRSDYLVLKQTRHISPLISVDDHWFIDLSNFRGWPRGNLANDLRKYALHLFDTGPIKQETVFKY